MTPGGSHNGVIGALAGIGLRMTGNRGRFRCGYLIQDNDRVISPKDLCLKYNIDGVRECVSEKIEGW